MIATHQLSAIKDEVAVPGLQAVKLSRTWYLLLKLLIPNGTVLLHDMSVGRKLSDCVHHMHVCIPLQLQWQQILPFVRSGVKLARNW